MRIRISHETRYRYDAPINGVIQTLRLTPRNHDGQYVAHWRIDVSEDCRLDVHEDAFGNITHTFTAEGPFAELALQGKLIASSTFKNTSVFTLVAIMYLTMSIPLILLVRHFEKKANQR